MTGGAMCMVLMLAVAATGSALADTYSEIVLYKNAWTPLRGNPQQNWKLWSNAYTATTARWHGEVMHGRQHIVQAEAVAVFLPNCATCNTGVALWACDDLNDFSKPPPGACDAIALFADSGMSPHPYRADVTASLQHYIDLGKMKNLTFATWGNGREGILLYEVQVEVIWGIGEPPATPLDQRP